ncbi:MAG: 3-dehydroquinate synthase [Oscillospiraceae bacterium]|nr:3-dehydroquinate synthase [Oscillospiraceae bacterium]
MTTVTVRMISTEYPVMMENGLRHRCGNLIAQRISPCRIAVITDENVAPLYLQEVTASLEQAGFTVLPIIVAPGEGSKSFTTLSTVLEAMAAARFTRTDCALALGGGIMGDLTGFAAGCYLRGIPFVQMPTTLLSAVDASVGGKTAVNLDAGKNLAGLFYQPQMVLCDPECLRTLSPHCLADGAAEAIKTGILGDETLFAIYETGNPTEAYEEIIARCVAYKANIVAEDPTEHSVRKLLNLGHTIGHAIERASDFEISHGHAVAIGMAYVTRAAQKRGLLSSEHAQRILATLRRNALPTAAAYTAEALDHLAKVDKKAAGTSITMILPERIGQCRMEKIPLDAMLAWIADGEQEDSAI